MKASSAWEHLLAMLVGNRMTSVAIQRLLLRKYLFSYFFTAQVLKTPDPTACSRTKMLQLTNLQYTLLWGRVRYRYHYNEFSIQFKTNTKCSESHECDVPYKHLVLHLLAGGRGIY